MTDPDFELVVRLHYAGLYRFALSLARSEPDAADLTQQTFYLWATRGHQLRDAGKLKSWLFTTLYREFLGRRRHADRFPHVELSSVEDELPAAEPPEIRSLDAEAVMQGLQAVDEVFRAPLALFYLEDRSYQEIAAILGIPTGTVMSRLARGKQQLRRLLNEAAAGTPGNLVRLEPRAPLPQPQAHHDP
ncbi:MAG: RNA polymerase sigma factor [Verrucomicrobiales bacterium]|nr:RNA polymerase sigma factor [Verrucomicrobiales bacterium]